MSSSPPSFTFDSLQLDTFTQAMGRLLDATSADHPPTLSLDLKHSIEELHRSETTVVYRAWPDIEKPTLLKLRGDEPEPLVFKLVSSSTNGALERLEHEYQVYQRLQDLQGTRVPKCWGLFYSPNKDNQPSSVGCLVLEDCGDRMPFNSIWKMPHQMRWIVVRTWQELHRRGIIHGAMLAGSTTEQLDNSILLRRNVDTASGMINPCIINFDDAVFHDSESGCPMAKIDVFDTIWGFRDGDLSNPEKTFPCEELREMANGYLWIPPRKYNYKGRCPPVSAFIELPSEELLDNYAPGLGRGQCTEHRRVLELLGARITRWKVLKDLESTYGGRVLLPELCQALDEPEMSGLDEKLVEELEEEYDRMRYEDE